MNRMGQDKQNLRDLQDLQVWDYGHRRWLARLGDGQHGASVELTDLQADGKFPL